MKAAIVVTTPEDVTLMNTLIDPGSVYTLEESVIENEAAARKMLSEKFGIDAPENFRLL